MERVHLIAWSDYLCPWCYNGSVRLARLEEEFGDRLQLEFRSWLLRPQPRRRATGPEDLEKFRAYTRSWLRPAGEEDAGEFRVWEGDAGPPSHSVPPHRVAKAAAELGGDAFRRMHRRLLRAYFAENLDVTDPETLHRLWQEAGLPAGDFQRHEAPELLDKVLAEHAEAQELGVTGVPTVMLAHQRIPVLGALPLETWRRWLHRALDGDAS